MNKPHRAQGDRNGHGQKGSGGEREIPRAAAGRPVFSLRPHERCDCLPTSPRQESSPSGGQRPLYLPGRRETQGRLCQILRRSRRLGARGVGGGMRCKKKKRSCFSICVINTCDTHTPTLRGHRTHKHTDGLQTRPTARSV